MQAPNEQAGRLIVTADDWGYSPRVNEGIEEAARCGALDAVSAMVLRSDCDPGPLRECRVAVGLHLELPERSGGRELLDAPWRQAEVFETIFGAPPAHIDGHHHCHASLPLASAAEDLAADLRVPLRAVGEDHRFRLQERGILCAHRLVGRLSEADPALPWAIAEAIDEGALPWGVTEWMVHPGRADPAAETGYNEAREEDLALVLELAENELLRDARSTHRLALAGSTR
jgi:predicted glycoside hydrolase/deacetylase ChbG (UPF0249 family)